MATARGSSNKAKIARRVVEVLEFFDDNHPQATVMDIVRRYDRPQSSTSELLSSLVELGLLHKDPYSRSYRPTVRAALLGATTQADMVRDGRLVRFMDRLAAQTGLSVILYGKIGLEAQIVNLRHGAQSPSWVKSNFFGGMKEALGRNAAGWLLLSTLEPDVLDGALRRLNAEAGEAEKFNQREMHFRVGEAARSNIATGPAGFGSSGSMVATLLPGSPHEDRLAVGIVLNRETSADPSLLAQYIEQAAESYLAAPPAARPVQQLVTAA